MTSGRFSPYTKINHVGLSKDAEVALVFYDITTVGSLLSTPFKVLMRNPILLEHWDEISGLICDCKSMRIVEER